MPEFTSSLRAYCHLPRFIKGLVFRPIKGSPMLPIEESAAAFYKLREDYLNKSELSDIALAAIRESCGLCAEDGKKSEATLWCDEAHSHSYPCLGFRSSVAGIVERLVLEVERYKGKLAEIKAITE